MEHLLTVIIPVYNVADCLERCLDSVINQTFTNLEIIIINDGSTDNSAEICKRYKELDKRIIYIEKENGGLSSARNVAMEVASGDLVTFVDSDDWLELNTYEKMLQSLDAYKADIVMCDCKASRTPVGILHGTGVMEFSGKAFTEKILKDEIGSQLWKFVYKKKLWDGIVSPDKRHAQDMMILHKVTGKAEKVLTIEDQLYVYNDERETSTSNSKKNFVKNKMDRALAFWGRLDYSVDNDYAEDVKSIIIDKAMRFTADAYSDKSVLEERFSSDRKTISQYIAKYSAYIKNLNIPSMQKIRIKIIGLMPKLYSVGYSLMHK